MPLRFHDFLLDSDGRQLLRGSRELRLSAKALDLLVCLIARRPDVIEKRYLLTMLWPDSLVVEANLTVAVAEIRRTLGDDRQAPRFIRTVHGVGYAFCAQAVEVGGRVLTASRRSSSGKPTPAITTDGAAAVAPDPRGDSFDLSPDQLRAMIERLDGVCREARELRQRLRNEMEEMAARPRPRFLPASFR